MCKKYEGSDHPFGDYLDEYFKLDCEDIIGGDIKCRFRYRKTVPNDYGLTVEEVSLSPSPDSPQMQELLAMRFLLLFSYCLILPVVFLL